MQRISDIFRFAISGVNALPNQTAAPAGCPFAASPSAASPSAASPSAASPSAASPDPLQTPPGRMIHHLLTTVEPPPYRLIAFTELTLPFVTPPGRLVFSNFATPSRHGSRPGRPLYGATLGLSDGATILIRNAMLALVHDSWDDALRLSQIPNLPLGPARLSDNGSSYLEPTWLRTSTAEPPICLAANLRRLPTTEIQQHDTVRFHLRLRTWQTQTRDSAERLYWRRGLKAELVAIQLVGHDRESY